LQKYPEASAFLEANLPAGQVGVARIHLPADRVLVLSVQAEQTAEFSKYILEAAHSEQPAGQSFSTAPNFLDMKIYFPEAAEGIKVQTNPVGVFFESKGSI
jgi:hypothetical protein